MFLTKKKTDSTMYKNNIFNCFTWVKIEWWLFIGIYMVTFMTPLSLTDNIDNTVSKLNLHGAPWKVAISMMWFILASNLIIYFPFLSWRSVYIVIQKSNQGCNLNDNKFIFFTFLQLHIKSLSFGSKTGGSVKMVWFSVTHSCKYQSVSGQRHTKMWQMFNKIFSAVGCDDLMVQISLKIIILKVKI